MTNKKVPILFCVFKRMEAIKAFESIRKYKPERLYIAADGPRDYVAGEKDDCEKVRNAIISLIDWSCDVKTLFRSENLGCTNAIYKSISWFFENEEYGVIVEDDVILSQDFYKLSEDALEHYKDTEKIMMIGAQNRSGKHAKSSQLSFGTYTYIWGWATWRRSWGKMDINMQKWPKCNKWHLFKTYGFGPGVFKWRSYAMAYKNASSGSWDTRWAFSVFYNDGLTLMPQVNLSTNIGIGIEGGTNYEVGDEDPYVNLKIGELKWPVEYPQDIKEDKSQKGENKRDYLRQRWIGLKKKLKR